MSTDSITPECFVLVNRCSRQDYRPGKVVAETKSTITVEFTYRNGLTPDQKVFTKEKIYGTSEWRDPRIVSKDTMLGYNSIAERGGSDWNRDYLTFDVAKVQQRIADFAQADLEKLVKSAVAHVDDLMNVLSQIGSTALPANNLVLAARAELVKLGGKS